MTEFAANVQRKLPRFAAIASSGCLALLMTWLSGCEKHPVTTNGTGSGNTQPAGKAPRPPAGSEAAARPSRPSQLRGRPTFSTGIYAALARRDSAPLAAKIDDSADGLLSGEDLQARYTRHKPALTSLPHWKRKEVHEIRLTRQKIFQAGEQEAEPLRSVGPAERRAWTKAWQDRHRKELKDLDRREYELLRVSKPPEPGREQVLGLLDRLRESEPILAEGDLVVIEWLLPSDDELQAPYKVFDEPTVRLIKAHRLLAERFPQSASRGSGGQPEAIQ